eukprot:Gregarina_sp_Poly_1__5265@NODE_278_length_10191_cov_434_260174_g242_i0_p6_GENE_NODE_278_length_10191_cov_434_260174_g242_i0NODE_278_length_10191_cov_434_260174_g242_i0_p6_ORF_typecomplete_len155_score13_07Gar1/PF04410_14/6_7e15_NODE_278_length_10191_cov_434_260174_g242_i055135977
MPPGFRGRGNRGGRGGSRGGRGGFQQPVGPPNEIVGERVLLFVCIFILVEVGYSLHTCEGELVGAVTKLADQVPYFNGRVFLENKAEIGKVDEILGPLNQMVSSQILGPMSVTFQLPVCIHQNVGRSETGKPGAKHEGERRIARTLGSLECSCI